MAEALAFGTLALHREVQPESLVLPQTEDPTNEAIRGLNKGASTVPQKQGHNVHLQFDSYALLSFIKCVVGHFYVRLAGQDAERGTFNQRHAAVYDQETSERCATLLLVCFFVVFPS
jgi:hypothetical protein